MNVFQESAVRAFADKIEAAFHHQLVSLMAYGSTVNNRATIHSDIDFFLMLRNSEHSIEDIKVLQEIIADQRDLMIDLSLQYLDEQRSEASHFHDGTKGPLALSYLSSAKLLKGENIFAKLLDELDVKSFRQSAYESVGYYLDTMRREVLSHGFDNEAVRVKLRKYTMRSLIDAFLFSNKTDMAPYKGMDFESVFTAATNHKFTKSIIANHSTSTPSELLTIIESVYSKMGKYLS